MKQWQEMNHEEKIALIVLAFDTHGKVVTLNRIQTRQTWFEKLAPLNDLTYDEFKEIKATRIKLD